MLSACAGVPAPLDNLAAKAFDFVRRHAAKVVVERITRFELLAVDEDRVGARERVPRGVVEVAKQGEATVGQRGRAVFVLPLEA